MKCHCNFKLRQTNSIRFLFPDIFGKRNWKLHNLKIHIGLFYWGGGEGDGSGGGDC